MVKSRRFNNSAKRGKGVCEEVGRKKLSFLSGRVSASEVSAMAHALASLIVDTNNELHGDEMVSLGY